jgi:hypothetical protein
LQGELDIDFWHMPLALIGMELSGDSAGRS